MNTLLLDRKEAASFLNVSTRTLDRYIAKNIFSVKRKKGKVFLLQSELENWKEKKEPEVAQVVEETKAVQASPGDNNKYKILYEETRKEIDKKDALLQQMHYQLGILETQAKQAIPALEAEKNEQQLLEEIEKIEDEKRRLLASLTITHRGRIVFFIFAFFFFLLSVGLFLGIISPHEIFTESTTS